MFDRWIKLAWLALAVFGAGLGLRLLSHDFMECVAEGCLVASRWDHSVRIVPAPWLVDSLQHSLDRGDTVVVTSDTTIIR